MVTPSSGSQTTGSFYDNLGRLTAMTYPDNTSVTNEYYPSGALKKTFGSRTYPVEYTNDVQAA